MTQMTKGLFVGVLGEGGTAGTNICPILSTLSLLCPSGMNID